MKSVNLSFGSKLVLTIVVLLLGLGLTLVYLNDSNVNVTFKHSSENVATLSDLMKLMNELSEVQQSRDKELTELNKKMSDMERNLESVTKNPSGLMKLMNELSDMHQERDKELSKKLSYMRRNLEIVTEQSNAEKDHSFSALFNPGDEADALFRSARTAIASSRPKHRVKLNLVNADPEFKFFMCNAPKTGCTAWAFFWEYINTGRRWSSEHMESHPGLIHELRRPDMWADNLTKPEIDAKMEKHKKVAIARNPYVRFLSSYQDWLGRQQMDETQVPFDKFADEFLKLTRGVETNFWDRSHMNHILSVSSNCQIGMHKYTVLRVEEQSLWFDHFVTKYHLKQKMDEYTSHGNLVFSSGLREDSLVQDFTAQIAGKEPWPSDLFKSKHHRGSAEKVTQYYTPAIAKQVTEIFFDDLVNFGYPLWDGVAENFRFV